VDLLSGANGEIIAGANVFTSVGATFAESIEGEFITIGDWEPIRIDAVTDGTTLELDSPLSYTYTDQTFRVYDASGDLLIGDYGKTDAGTTTFVAVGAGFTDEMVDAELTIGDLGTFTIVGVTDDGTLELAETITYTFTDQEYVIHEKRERIRTLQEFVTNVNAAGISCSYDLATQEFRVPLSFAADMDLLELPIDFGVGSDDFGISTDATGILNAAISGAFDLVVDLDGPTGTEGLFFGIDSSVLEGTLAFDVEDLEVAARFGFMGVTAGGPGTGSGVHVEASASLTLECDMSHLLVEGTDGEVMFSPGGWQFRSASTAFTEDMVGWTLITGGEEYEVLAVIGEHVLKLDPALESPSVGQQFVLDGRDAAGPPAPFSFLDLVNGELLDSLEFELTGEATPG